MRGSLLMMNDQVLCHLKHTCAGIGMGSNPHTSLLSQTLSYFTMNFWILTLNTFHHVLLYPFNNYEAATFLDQVYGSLWMSSLPPPPPHPTPTPAPRKLTTKPIVKPSSWSSGIRIANIQYKSQACQGPYCAGVVLHTDWWDRADLVCCGHGCEDCSMGLWDMWGRRNRDVMSELLSWIIWKGWRLWRG